MFYAGGKYDLCFGAAELLEFVDEVVKFHGGAEGYFDEHGVIAGDAATFNYVSARFDVRIEGWFLIWFYLKVYECFYKIADSSYIYHSLVAS